MINVMSACFIAIDSILTVIPGIFYGQYNMNKLPMAVMQCDAFDIFYEIAQIKIAISELNVLSAIVFAKWMFDRS